MEFFALFKRGKPNIKIVGKKRRTQKDRKELAEAIRQVLISQTREGTQGTQHDSTEVRSIGFPKLVIASSGKKTAVLLDGVMFGKGVSAFSLKSDGSTLTLNIEGINVEQFEAGTPERFQSFYESLLRDELSTKR